MDEKDPIIENNFTYHAPKNGQDVKYMTLCGVGKDLAYLIKQLVPKSREQTLNRPSSGPTQELRETHD
jgi:hypothetical protein